MVPVRSDVKREDEIEDQAVSADLVLQKMDAAKNRMNIVVLDACRNNPFARSFRSNAQGLAQMDAPSGTIVAFATAPGSVAADRRGNVLYTQHLVANIRQPGLKIEDVFKRVRVSVKRDSQGQQVPWRTLRLKAIFIFKYGKPGQTPPADLPSETVASIAPVQSRHLLLSFPSARSRPGSSPPSAWSSSRFPRAASRWAVRTMKAGRAAGERQHEVCVESFWMGKYEVTLEQYKKSSTGTTPIITAMSACR